MPNDQVKTAKGYQAWDNHDIKQWQGWRYGQSLELGLFFYKFFSLLFFLNGEY